MAIQFKLDENLNRACADELRRVGFDTSTVPLQGLCSASDHQIIEVCRKEKRCLITLDLDFGNPLLFNPAHYFGIAVLRLPKKPTSNDFSVALQTLVSGLKTASIEKRLWIIERDRIREYRPENDAED